MNFSPVISGAPGQVTWTLDQGISRRNESLRDVVKTGIYQHGLTRMANELHIAAGNLCNQINGTGQRHLSVDSLERYIETTGDLAHAKRLIAELSPLMGQI